MNSRNPSVPLSDFSEPLLGFDSQIYLGSDAFLQRMQAEIRGTEALARGGREIPRAQRRPIKQPMESYRKNFADRDEAMAAAYASGDYTLQQIAEAFGVHYATVSRAVGKRSRMAECKA